MDAYKNQQELSSNQSELIHHDEATEETPLTNIQTNDEDEEVIPCVTAEALEWNTDLISQVKIF